MKVASRANSKVHAAGGDGDGPDARQQLLDAGREEAGQHKQQEAWQFVYCKLTKSHPALTLHMQRPHPQLMLHGHPPSLPTSCCIPGLPVLAAEGRQTAFMVGASVYDGVHNACRGYGTIRGPGLPKDDGSRTWVTEFPDSNQKRACAIQEKNLHLALIPHYQRNSPSHEGQAFVVMAGKYKGQAGTTKTKVGLGSNGGATRVYACWWRIECTLP